MNKGKSMNSLGMFDLARGILMILVVGIHSVTCFFKYWEYDRSENLWLYPALLLGGILLYGGIAMFFMMSGYGFRPMVNKKRIRKRCEVILKPYAIVTLIITVLCIIKKIILHKTVLEAITYDTLPYLLGLCPGEREFSGILMSSIGPMWFLVVLLNASILLSLLMKGCKEWMQGYAVIACVLVGYKTSQIMLLPYCLSQSMIAVGYLYAGMQIREHRLLEVDISWKAYGLMSLYLIPVMLFGEVEVSQNVWKLGEIDLIATYVAAFLLLRGYIKIYRMQGKIAGGIRTIGRYSLWILCIHTIEYMVVPWDKYAAYFVKQPILGLMIQLVFRVGFIFVGCAMIRIIKKRNGKTRKDSNQIDA